MFSRLLFLFSLSLPVKALAAACCGGGFAAPNLIAGDEKAQFSASFTNTQVVIDNVDSEGIWRTAGHHQTVRMLRLEAAHIFWDRYQAGFALPVIERSLLGDRKSGVGDTTLSLGYEFLPDWNYHPIRPKGIGYLQMTLPTGVSRAEASGLGLESRGQGFYALGFGTLLTKNISVFDLVVNAEAHRSFSKSIRHSSLGEVQLNPGWGGSLMMGAGYNVSDMRLGASLTWNYEDAIGLDFNDSGSSGTEGSVERYATGSLSLSYMWGEDWSGSIAYLDQTLFGSPVNTTLGRGFSLQLQRRWSR